MRITKIGIPPGGDTNQVLVKSSGTDYDVEWGTGSGTATPPGGLNTQVQFNDGGVFGGDSGFTYNKTTNRLTLGSLVLNDVVDPGVDTDKFLVLTSLGVVSYRNGASVLVDIGGVPTTRTLTINGTSYDLSANRTWSVGTVTSVGITAGTGISVANSPVTGSGSITVTNTAPDQTVSLTQGGTTTITGTYPNFTISSADQYVGTVTSVGLSAPTGFSVANSPVISSGTLALSFASGYSLPTTASQTNWDTAYTNRITSLTTTGSSGAATLISNTLNIPNYTLAGLGGVPTGRTITINGTAQDLSTDRTYSVGTVTSIATSAPITGGTITGSGTIGITQASGSSNGYLSSTDWTTFNNKQNALTNPVTGTGSSGQLAYFNGTTSITSESILFWDATNDRLGIGVNSPAYKLDLYDSAGNFLQLYHNDGTYNRRLWITSTASGTNQGITLNATSSTGSDNLIFQASNNEVMRIKSTGLVGIGTDSPIVAGGGYTGVHINGSSDGASLVLSRQNANIVYLYTFGTSGDFAIENPGAQIFRAGSSEKMRIFSTGNVFIGSSPSDSGYKLDVNGTGRFQDTLTASVSSGNNIVVSKGSGPSIEFQKTSATAQTWQLAGENIFKIYNITAGTTPVQLDSSGNLGLGVTPTTYKLDVNGTGRFQDTLYATKAGAQLQIGGGNTLAGIFQSGANDILYIADWATGNNGLRLNVATGNLGLGVTPSAWASGIKSLEINYAGNGLWSSTPTQLIANSNAYYASGGWTYASNNPSAYYSQFSGGHYWYNAPSGTAGNAITFTQAMTLDASGNLGVNVTPSAWISSWKVIQGNSAGSFGVASANNGMYVMSNAYYNTSGNPIYTASSFATMYQQINGGHFWYYAGSGTAGNTISWTAGMQLTSNGDLIIGSGADTGESLQVTGDAKVNGRVIAGTDNSTNGTEILRGKYPNGALTVIGSEKSNGGPVIGYGVKPSTTSADAFLSSTGITIPRGSYTIDGGNHKWYAGASQTVTEDSSVTMSQTMKLLSTGQLKLNNYTTTTSFSGTTTGYLAFTNTGDVITKSPANVLSEIGAQASLTNPVTGTGTNNEIAYFNSTGSTIASLPTATYPSLTELSYVKGVTSSIQTQLNAKGSGTIGGSGTTNYIAKFSSSPTTIADSSITDNGTTVELLQGQLKFPAIQNASSNVNTLDDYEEGDWTPTYKCSAVNFSSVTYDPVTQGRYVKIGKTVFFNGEIRTDAITKGSAAGSLMIGGFPIARADNRDLNLTITYARDFLSEYPRAGSSIEGLGTTSDLALYRTRPNNTTGDAALTQADVNTGVDDNWIIFYGFYRTLN